MNDACKICRKKGQMVVWCFRETNNAKIESEETQNPSVHLNDAGTRAGKVASRAGGGGGGALPSARFTIGSAAVAGGITLITTARGGGERRERAEKKNARSLGGGKIITAGPHHPPSCSLQAEPPADDINSAEDAVRSINHDSARTKWEGAVCVGIERSQQVLMSSSFVLLGQSSLLTQGRHPSERRERRIGMALGLPTGPVSTAYDIEGSESNERLHTTRSQSKRPRMKTAQYCAPGTRAWIPRVSPQFDVGN